MVDCVLLNDSRTQVDLSLSKFTVNFEVYSAILSAQIQPIAAELTGHCFILQINNDPKHAAKATQDFLRANKLGYSSLATSVIWSYPNRMSFLLTEDKTEPTNKVKAAAVKHLKGRNSFGAFDHVHGLQAVVDCKGFAKY